jgi:outer membrane protein OmpA-like peptidoglycan-associated protein
MEQQERKHAQQLAQEANMRAKETAQQLTEAEARSAHLQKSEAEARARAEQAALAAEDAHRERAQALDRMREALNQVAETRQSARGLIVSIPDVLFDFDQSTLRSEGRERLSKIAGIVLGSGTTWTFSIEGYTDNIGSTEYNDQLSRQRAQIVANYLTAAGVPRSSISDIEGFGESQPIASNDSASGRQRNRRVEITIENPPAPIAD